jgi:hypothetical protein
MPVKPRQNTAKCPYRNFSAELLCCYRLEIVRFVENDTPVRRKNPTPRRSLGENKGMIRYNEIRLGRLLAGFEDETFRPVGAAPAGAFLARARNQRTRQTFV